MNLISGTTLGLFVFGSVVTDLPFEIMFFAERSFGRRDGQAEAVGGFFFHAHLAGHVGERQADAHGVAICFDEHQFIIGVAARAWPASASRQTSRKANFRRARAI